MSAMSPEDKKKQAKARRDWIKRMDYLIECTKLPHDDPEYMHPSDLLDDVLYEIPDYDMTKKTKEKYFKMLGVESE